MRQARFNPIADELFSALSTARDRVLLVAPFIKDDVLSKCLEASGRASSHCVVTDLRLDAYLSHALDIEAIRSRLSHSGFTAFSLSRLHAKAFVVDEHYCFIGSNNLTSAGLYRNVELGVVIDDRAEVRAIRQRLEEWLSSESAFAITPKVLKSWEGIERQPTTRRDVSGGETVEPMTEARLVELATTMGGWKGEVLSLLISQLPREFSLSELYDFEPHFKRLHPANENIPDKLRQVLQQLRDLGLISFLAPGRYLVNW